MRQASFAKAFIGSALALLLATQGSAQTNPQTAAPTSTATAAAQNAPTAPAPTSADYRLGAGDVLRIMVFQNPDLTLETRVSESGVISYPLLGAVKVGGMPASQAEKLIADGLRSGNFVKQPQVSVLVMQVRGNQVSVLGQVNRPGRYPIEVADMRLTDVLATAGGAAPTGAEVVTVVGTRGNKPYRVEIDLPKVFAAGGRGDDIAVQNGDVVWVDRAPLIYIYGEVQRPGALRLERGMTVMQALATGGGLSARGTEKGMRVHRRGADGKLQVVQPAMDDLLRDGDVVYVRESIF